jgi:DNA polymerase V
MKLKQDQNFEFFSIENNPFQGIPLFTESVPAGFPSPAEDYMDTSLNLQDHLIQNPSATFCVRAVGESMKNAGIQSGDMMLVDRSLEPQHNSIILAVIDGEFTVKRISVTKQGISLMPENDDFPPIPITEEMDFQVWGIVTFVIHKAI